MIATVDEESGDVGTARRCSASSTVSASGAVQAVGRSEWPQLGAAEGAGWTTAALEVWQETQLSVEPGCSAARCL